MKKITRIFVAVTLFAGLIANSYAENAVFSDVSEKHWAYECINEMVERNVVSGYPDKTFRPDDNVSRAEFARMTAGAAELRAEPVLETSFADVEAGKWYASFIESVKDFMKGYEKDGVMVFEPDVDALREDIVVALVKLAGFDAENADWDIPELAFSDADSISEDAKRYVEIAYAKGIIAGYDDNTIRPKNPVSRAEAVALLQRACPKPVEKPEVTPEPTKAPEVTPEPTKAPDEAEPDEAPYTMEATLAVVKKKAQPYVTTDGDDVEALTVMYKGEEEELILFETGKFAELELNTGDVIFFETDRRGYIRAINLIYDYSEDTFGNLVAKNWSCHLWDEGTDYKLAEGYIVNVDDLIMLAPRTAIESGYLDTSVDIDDDNENGVAIFGLSEDCLVYEFDAYNDDITNLRDRLSVQNGGAVSESNFGNYEVDGEDGIFKGNLVKDANYAIVIVDNDEVVEAYVIVK